MEKIIKQCDVCGKSLDGFIKNGKIVMVRDKDHPWITLKRTGAHEGRDIYNLCGEECFKAFLKEKLGFEYQTDWA